MAIWTLHGEVDGHHEAACLVDSVTETAFGPMFRDADEVDAFLIWNTETGGMDPRRYIDSRLADRVAEFRKHVKAVAAH